MHLAFTLGGKRIAYAYIRKNGCSAFKRMMLRLIDSGDPADMVRHFPFRPYEQYDAVIFVWRDPLERLVSLYRNKIIERKYAVDLLAAYRKTMNAEPGSFEDFVRFACMERDPHCWTQQSHLKRMRYTHAIPLDALHQTMREIAGPAADAYFSKKVNKTAQHPVRVSEKAREMVLSHYAGDYAMIHRILARQERLVPANS